MQSPAPGRHRAALCVGMCVCAHARPITHVCMPCQQCAVTTMSMRRLQGVYRKDGTLMSRQAASFTCLIHKPQNRNPKPLTCLRLNPSPREGTRPAGESGAERDRAGREGGGGGQDEREERQSSVIPCKLPSPARPSLNLALIRTVALHVVGRVRAEGGKSGVCSALYRSYSHAHSHCRSPPLCTHPTYHNALQLCTAPQRVWTRWREIAGDGWGGWG